MNFDSNDLLYSSGYHEETQQLPDRVHPDLASGTQWQRGRWGGGPRETSFQGQSCLGPVVLPEGPHQGQGHHLISRGKHNTLSSSH